MIRGRAGDRRRGLDNVQTIHLAAGTPCFLKLIQFAAAIKLLHVANMSRPTGQEIGIAPQDDLGLLRPINRFDRAAESNLPALRPPAAAAGVPLMPLSLPAEPRQRIYLRGRRGRSDARRREG